MKKIQEHYKPPGREVDVEVRCKLEKFFYGGTKQVTRSRRIYRDFQEFHDDKQYRLDVPKGAAESWECKMKGGDMNLEMQTDTLRFVVKSKPHKVLERRGGDLHLLREVRLRPDAHLQPFLQTAVSTVEGRTVLLWGQNPLYSQAASSSTVLHVSVEGEGIGDRGHLHLSARVGTKTGSQETRIVTVKTTYTKIKFCVGVSVPASLEDLQESIREVLQWPEDHPVNLRRCSSDQPFAEQSILETEDSEVILECRAQCVAEVPMSLRRARDLLGAMAAFAGTDAFEEGLSGCLPAVGTARHEALLRKLWEPACRSALLCGYEPCLEGLWKAAQRALWLLREEPDGETLRQRFADFGFEPKMPPTPRPPRRRKLPRPEVENFLLRNALGPASWSDSLPDPGSETEPEEEAPDYEERKAQQLRETEEHERAFLHFLRHGAGHAPDRRRAKRLGPFGAAAHPLMLRRAAKRAELASECSLQLRPLFCGEPMQLFTKPTCFLQFYSNAGQSAHARPGQLEPTPMFAVAVCCPTGAKKAGKEEWMRLRHQLLPALKHMLLICLGRARNLLPRQLSASPALACYVATSGVSVNSGRVESAGDDVADESSEGEDNAEVIQLAKRRVEECRGETCDFDDLDILDELESAASAIRKERREQRRRLRAARESWMREAKREANLRALDGPSLPTPVGQGEVASTLWKQLATDAVKSGDYYLAQWYYSKEAHCYGLLAPEMESDERENEKKDDENHVLERAVVLSNRSLCLCRVQQAEAALRDARCAAALRPDWARAWSRIGAAAFAQSALSEACEAWRKAVQLDSSEENLRGLEETCRRKATSSVRECKEQGNLALRGKDWGLAICCYTEALAGIPPQKYMEQSDTAIQDDYSLLRSILFANRSAAFASAGRWQAAVRDANCAVAEGQAYPKAFCRLGVALLGCSENEGAYVAFAKSLKAEERNLAASKGRQSCLQLAPRWSSSAAAYRRRRFLRDAGRPRCRTRVFLLSELRFGQGSNEAWVHGIHATKFLDDVLILTGNVADSFRALERGLTALRSKFRRIFFVPGNNEMWITPVEMERFPDSVCKFWAILEMCDRLGVDVAPAAICEGVYVVPLFSWYNAEFDVADPFPDPQLQHDKYAKWPMDPNHQVWRYMMALNRDYLQKPYHDTVITCSHFVPRSELPVVQEFSMAKASGCAELDDQVRQARSSCHVYGHSSKQCGKEIEGVIYLNAPHKGGGLEEPIPCVFNGEKVCCEMVSVH
ncbi:HOP3 [Symbiodinium sp. CCMP2592]|nr:HOP3 [Symbiodinium sp. CCMP2592]